MIRMSEQKDMSGDKTLSGGGFNINPVDIIMYLLSKWYWFVLSVSLFGGYAWYQYAKLPLYLFTVSHRHDKGRLFKQHRSRAGPF